MPKPVFVREATGLVRNFSLFDLIWINLGMQGIQFAFVFVSSTAPLMGGDVLTAALISFVLLLVVALSIGLVGTITPRSAGEYVFTSRYVNPSLGFISNGVFYVVQPFLGTAITLSAINFIGFAPLFSYLGQAANNLTLTNWGNLLSVDPTSQYIVGAVFTILIVAIPVLGNRVFKLANKIALPFILFTFLLVLAILVVTPQNVALDRLNTFAGNSSMVSGMNSWGAQNNSPVPSITDFGNTIRLAGLFGANLFGTAVFAVYFAGETKEVSKTLPLAMVISLASMTVLYAAGVLLSYNTFGYVFLSNLYTKSINFGLSPFAVTPYTTYLAAIISNNMVIGGFILVGQLLMNFWYTMNVVALGGRLLLSYSFDRIVPEFFSDVSDRFHVPVKGMIVTLILGLGAAVFYIFSSTAAIAFILYDVFVSVMFIFPIALVGVGLLLYKYRRRAEYEKSMASISFYRKFYDIIAIGAIVAGVFFFWDYLTTPAFLGTIGAEGFESIAVILVGLFAMFQLSKYLNKRRGIDFSLIFSAIPPE